MPPIGLKLRQEASRFDRLASCFDEYGAERFGEFGLESDADAVVFVGQDQ